MLGNVQVLYIQISRKDLLELRPSLTQIISRIMVNKALKVVVFGDKKAKIIWCKKVMLFTFDLIFNGYVAQLVRAQHS